MIQSMIPERVEQITVRKGMKRRAVAERAGFTEQQFCDMMHRRRLIKDTDVLAIANALGVTPNDLYGISRDAPPKSV